MKAAESWSKGKVEDEEPAEFVALIAQLQEEALHLEPSELVGLAAEFGLCRCIASGRHHGARQRLENLEELARALSDDVMLQEMEDGGELDPIDRLQAFLDRAALTAQADNEPDESGHITLLTTHLAKGLEYPVVFVSGLVEGGSPHRQGSGRRSGRRAQVGLCRFYQSDEAIVFVPFSDAICPG